MEPGAGEAGPPSRRAARPEATPPRGRDPGARGGAKWAKRSPERARDEAPGDQGSIPKKSGETARIAQANRTAGRLGG